MSHFGFTNNDATESWDDTLWINYNETNPRNADEGINLNFWFDLLDPGASVSFTWVYILRTEDLMTAMGQVREAGGGGGMMMLHRSSAVAGLEGSLSPCSCARVSSLRPVYPTAVWEGGRGTWAIERVGGGWVEPGRARGGGCWGRDDDASSQRDWRGPFPPAVASARRVCDLFTPPLRVLPPEPLRPLPQVSTVTIVSPTTVVSGSDATFSAMVTAFANPVE